MMPSQSFQPSNLAFKIIGVAVLFGFFAGWISVFASLNEARHHKAAQSWQSRRGQRRESWHPEIAGTFAGGENRFNASKIGYGMEFTSNSEAQADRPSHVILVRNNSLRTTWMALSIGLFFGFFPFFLYVWGKIRPSARGPAYGYANK